MSGLYPDILHGIGNTPLLALRNVVPENGCRLLLKLESQNPTGSMKDRMALAMIEAAEADGRLPQHRLVSNPYDLAGGVMTAPSHAGHAE